MKQFLLFEQILSFKRRPNPFKFNQNSNELIYCRSKFFPLRVDQRVNSYGAERGWGGGGGGQLYSTIARPLKADTHLVTVDRFLKLYFEFPKVQELT